MNIQIFCRKLRFRCQRFCALFSAFKIKSGTQFYGCNDLSTLCRDKSHPHLPLPQIVCLQSPRFWETRDQRFPVSLSLSLSLPLSLRRAGRKEPWERGWYWSRSTTAWSRTTQRFAAVELLLSYILVPIMRTLRLTSSVALSRALANRSWVNVRVMLWCRKTSNYFQLLKVISRFPGFSFLQQHLT